jgi:chromosome segregation protein
MRLKQIKLAGFKSFVDPTTVSFPSNRGAIVGPNGCGKSNIIDAVRWVMGESSARQLRGESLTDVIFNGSNTRKPAVMASIELVFDNADGRIGGAYAGYAEIAIRRQVTRDSQSVYFLNGDKCRRRDIMDIFLGTGFGPRSYSIIEQGMISQLVEAKPEDLRSYLEEAAGISKYKERRRETENRIRHTEENLARLNDIREELTRQLDHLKRQSRDAERYRELKADERRVTAELLTLKTLAVQREVERLETEIRKANVELERALAEQRALDAAIERSRAAHHDHSEEFNKVQGRFYQLGADIARADEAIQYHQQRAAELEADRAAVIERRVEADRQLAMDEAQIAELETALRAIVPRVDAARERDLASTGALDAAEHVLAAWQGTWDHFNLEASANAREADVQSSRIEHVEQVVQRLRARVEKLDDESLATPGIPGDGDMAELALEIDEVGTRLGDLEARLEECVRALERTREELSTRELSLEEGRTGVQRLRHELASLEAVQQAALGRRAGGADDWLKSAGLAAARRVGDALSVVPGWELAVEAVLGDRLQGIEVASVDRFAETLGTLNQGRVTLVEAKRDVEARLDRPLLAALVRSPIELGALLHGVYAADSLEAALALRASLAPGESVITRSGVWLGANWIRLDRGGAGAVEQGIIHRGQDLEVLRARVEDAETHLATLQRRVVEGKTNVEALDRARNELQSTINEVAGRLGQLRADHGVHRVRLEEADARRDRANRERADVEQQIVQELRRLNEARQRLSEAAIRREQLDERRAALSQDRERHLGDVESARQRARADRDAFHELQVERQAFESRLTATATARDRLLRQQQELDERRTALDTGIGESRAPLPGLTAQRDTALAERLGVEERLNEVRRALEASDTDVRSLESQRGEREEAVAQVRAALEDRRVERQGLTVRRTTLTEQLERTGLTLDEVRAGLPPDATEESSGAELAKIEQRIQRLGAINLAAIEEFKSASERKTYLDDQHKDLTDALETLQNAIRKIDRETRARFKETFEAVNTRLGELFPKVFGGGHAYLELTGEDLLDTGVTLMARPPGKRNTSVNLLSGGEKALTAVALIFAIFQLNPSPVCLLDEVDAPLDDSNVLRFAELLREMSGDVQFVFITHNKLTMEMADHLMGVTMNEPGVSRLVSVDVEEAAAMAAV